MASGGKREGSGRKKGTANLKTKAIADMVAKSDKKTPLEVMLEAMYYAMEQVEYTKDPMAKKIFYEAAHSHAKDAAPYLHPKLANSVVDHKSSDGSMRPQSIEIVHVKAKQ